MVHWLACCHLNRPCKLVDIGYSWAVHLVSNCCHPGVVLSKAPDAGFPISCLFACGMMWWWPFCIDGCHGPSEIGNHCLVSIVVLAAADVLSPDPALQDSLQRLNEADPLAGEQTWPTDQVGYHAMMHYL